MPDFKPNSYLSKKEGQLVPEKKIEKVIAGTAKTKKKNEFCSMLISEDANNVKSYILIDVLIPAFKKLVDDIITNGKDIVLYGEPRGTKKGPSSRISYHNSYDEANGNRDRHNEKRGYRYADIFLDTRGEAEEVLVTMEEIISTYGLVSVADLYDMVGHTGSYTDNNYGWTDIRNASVIRTRDGYLLKLPRALPLN